VLIAFEKLWQMHFHATEVGKHVVGPLLAHDNHYAYILLQMIARVESVVDVIVLLNARYYGIIRYVT